MMNLIKNLSFKAKLIAGIVFIAFAIVIAVIVVVRNINYLVDINEEVDDSFRVSKSLADFRADNTRVRTLLLEVVDDELNIGHDVVKQIREEMQHIEREITDIDICLADYPDEYLLFSEIKTVSDALRDIRLQQLAFVREGQYSEADNLFRGDSYAFYEDLYQKTRAIEMLISEENERLQKATSAAGTRVSFSITIIAAITGLFVLMVVISIYRMMSRISRDIKEGVTVLGSSTAEIHTTVAEISTGASETATSISETTTTIEEIRQTSMVSGKKAQHLMDSSKKASEIGERGRETSQQMVDSMENIDAQMKNIHETITRLSEQNRSIGEITSTVADIADQSNMLAVNAAIEAAKAGEHGRGFSVVAQEIRSLSEQSKKSAIQVKEIVNHIQKAVTEAVEVINQGKTTVEEGGHTVAEDKEVVEKLIDAVNIAAEAAVQISSSSQQQITGMDQIVPAMENISQASEQNLSGIKQTQDAVQDLQKLSENLNKVIERYRL